MNMVIDNALFRVVLGAARTEFSTRDNERMIRVSKQIASYIERNIELIRYDYPGMDDFDIIDQYTRDYLRAAQSN